MIEHQEIQPNCKKVVAGDREGRGEQGTPTSIPTHTDTYSHTHTTSHTITHPHTALIGEQFLDSTASQLTYHGLCELNTAVKEGELCVFFRNNHFSTLLKRKVCWVLPGCRLSLP